MNINTILYFIAYLIIYSFAGWVIESVYKSIYEKKFVNSGFLIGPYCPIYGFGAVIMLLALSSLKEKPILLFIASFFMLSCWEYLVALILEKVFKTKYWDYSDLKFNIHGRVCLKNSIYWGVLGLVFIYFLHPFVENFIKQNPISLLIYIEIIIGITMLVDFIVSVVAIANFEGMIAKINELGENIKEKVKELKDLNEKRRKKVIDIEKESLESIEKMISNLKRRQAILNLRIYKQANRLKKAFPTMKSETITNFLNQKIDINKLKHNIKRKKKMKG